MLVSVVIPVFNGAATIARAIDSALVQDFDDDFEVIVVNDGSTDNTATVLSSYGDRIRVITQENRGLAAARNVGIVCARGEFIALLDADDWWEPQRLAKTIEPMRHDDQCVLSFCDGSEVDPDGRLVNTPFVPRNHAHAPTLREMLDVVWHIRPTTVTMRRCSLLRTGGFSEAFGRRGYGGEDVFAFLLLREQGRFAYVPEPLVIYTLSSFEQNFDKRLEVMRANGDGLSLDARLRGFVEGYAVFARLVRERYGRRARHLVRASVATQAGTLVGLGLAAMNRGDRALARRCYLMSLGIIPYDPRTYARLSWTFVPRAVGNRLLSFMTPRARRALSGPPYHVLQQMEK